jgi:hypothetical protein
MDDLQGFRKLKVFEIIVPFLPSPPGEKVGMRGVKKSH